MMLIGQVKIHKIFQKHLTLNKKFSIFTVSIIKKETTMINDIIPILTSFFSTKNKVQFVSFTYRNNKGELSKYTVLVNVNYINSLHKDLIKLQSLNLETETEKLVKNEIQKSLINSIYNRIEENRSNDNYTKEDYYERIDNNLKINENTFYFDCYVVSKTVLEPIEYKEVKSSEKTLLKNKIKKDLRVSKFREFKIDLSKIKNISINKNRLCFDCD